MAARFLSHIETGKCDHSLSTHVRYALSIARCSKHTVQLIARASRFRFFAFCACAS
jgi:hypothetical protein